MFFANQTYAYDPAGNRLSKVQTGRTETYLYGYEDVSNTGKKINGRKRHLVVDTIGLILAVVVHEASIQDRDGAKLVLERLKGCFPRLALIWARRLRR